MHAYLITLILNVALFGIMSRVVAVPTPSVQLCSDSPSDTSHFPVAAYDAPEPADPSERDRRRAVSRSYDPGGLVSSDPTPRISGASRLFEGWPDFPALPAARSDAVVIGEVIGAAAYLSNDKSNIYSEFHIRVEESLKWGDGARPAAGDVMAVTRVGGVVLYPNGHQRFYENTGWGLPRVGSRYVLFLVRHGAAGGYRILTGYELRKGRVVPLDSSPHFDRFRCSMEETFLGAVRAVVKEEGQDAPRQ